MTWTYFKYPVESWVASILMVRGHGEVYDYRFASIERNADAPWYRRYVWYANGDMGTAPWLWLAKVLAERCV